MKVRIESVLFSIAACLTSAASVPAGAQATEAAPRYRLTVMQPLPGQDGCGAYALNDRGQAVGYCLKFDDDIGEYRVSPFMWQGGTSVTPLPIPPRSFPYSPVYAINNNGWVAGIFDGGAVIFKGPGNIETIARGPVAWGWFAADINARGDVVGNGESELTGETQAFIYKDGVKTDLTSAGVDRVYAINYARQVAGQCAVAAPGGGTEQRACVYAGGRAAPLRGVGGNSAALDLNNKGQVVGQHHGFQRGFLYQRGAVTDLGANLPLSINGAGTILGANASTRIPFVRTGARVYRLPSQVVNLGNFVLDRVRQISEGGAIVGSGYYADRPTQDRGFILQPAL